MQEQLEVEKRAAKHGAAAVSIQAPVAQNSGSAEPCSACRIFESPLNFYRDVWDAIARCINSRCSECRLAPENMEFEKYISCHCFYLKTKFQINWAGGRVLGKWGALQACWRRSANAIWLQSCYFIVWLRCMRRNNVLLSSREFVLTTFLHCKIFANRSMIYLEHDFFALLSHMCFLVFCHTEQAAPRKVLFAYKSDGAYCNCANTWAHCISMN